ncbi:MAG: acyl-CoA dehydrogenase [Pseudomonadota bacterium]|nr:acyl-CoA dehydrogenase [Pseudomonadota bacterium]
MELLLKQRDLEFLIYEFLDTELLLKAVRYRDHDRETLDAVIEAGKKLAEDKFAPFAALLDANEPAFKDGRVEVIPELEAAIAAYVEGGFTGIAAEEKYGGMQYPWVIAQAACAYIAAADVSANAYGFLTHAAINLLSKYANEDQKKQFMVPMIEGRFFGTMCLSEPQAGSSLSDIKVRASRADNGNYLLSGTKMWISAGEHELSENIIHLVLAKVPGAPPGVKGISLFIVPKFRLNDDGSLGEKNNVQLVGLNHKMGFRGTTNTVLNFGEGGDCQGYLVGEENKGLFYMFHMMNEARVGIGMTATVLGYTGYLHSLQYAGDRPQGRHPGEKDPSSKQVPIIEHADIKRLLLAQKSAVEGSLALVLYCAWLLDCELVAETEEQRLRINTLLEILTPIAKSWPSEFCLEANKHAIQILGGYGYTRDFPLERFYRDNRLNPIHEGTHGVQGIDLLGRKVSMQDGAAFKLLLGEFAKTIEIAADITCLSSHVTTFEVSVEAIEKATKQINEIKKEQGDSIALANAGIYLDTLGHLVIGWIWLKQATTVVEASENSTANDEAFYSGKLRACDYFFRYEMPKIEERCRLLCEADKTCYEAVPECF